MTKLLFFYANAIANSGRIESIFSNYNIIKKSTRLCYAFDKVK